MSNPAAALDPSGTYGAISLTNGTLSSYNCVATMASSRYQIAGNNPLSTGLLYFEVTLSGSGVNNPYSEVGAGFISTAWTQSGSGGGGTFCLNYCQQGFSFVLAGGNLYLQANGNSGTQINFGAAPAVSYVLGFAVNLTTGKAWGRINNGNWNNNASYGPIAGVGGLDISGITAPIIPAVCAENVTFGPVVTQLNCGPFYSYQCPTGYGGPPASGTTLVTPSAQLTSMMECAQSATSCEITWLALTGSVADGLNYILDNGSPAACGGTVSGTGGVASVSTSLSAGFHQVALVSPDNPGNPIAANQFVVAPTLGTVIICEKGRLSNNGTLPGSASFTFSAVKEVVFSYTVDALEATYNYNYWFLDQNGNNFNGSHFAGDPFNVSPSPAITVTAVIESIGSDNFSTNVTGPSATVTGTFGISEDNSTSYYSISCNGTTTAATGSNSTTATGIGGFFIDPIFYSQPEMFNYGVVVVAPSTATTLEPQVFNLVG